MKCHILFSCKNEKNITNLWSAEFAQRATKVNDIFEHFIHQHLNIVYVFCLVTKCGHISSTAKGQLDANSEGLEKHTNKKSSSLPLRWAVILTCLSACEVSFQHID